MRMTLSDLDVLIYSEHTNHGAEQFMLNGCKVREAPPLFGFTMCGLACKQVHSNMVLEDMVLEAAEL
jgi:hypothetical protein